MRTDQEQEEEIRHRARNVVLNDPNWSLKADIEFLLTLLDRERKKNERR